MAKQRKRSTVKRQKKEGGKTQPVYKIRRAKRVVATAEPVDPAAVLREVVIPLGPGPEGRRPFTIHAAVTLGSLVPPRRFELRFPP